MDYAVVKTGGKQYKVSEGSILEVEKLSGAVNDAISFSEVLLLSVNGGVKIGKPLVSGAVVGATILQQLKGDKIRVAKFKAKSRYRRVTGHRQRLTRIQINSLGSGEKSKTTAEKKPIAKAKTAVRTPKTVKKV